jgi:hypothetical protein
MWHLLGKVPQRSNHSAGSLWACILSAMHGKPCRCKTSTTFVPCFVPCLYGRTQEAKSRWYVNAGIYGHESTHPVFQRSQAKWPNKWSRGGSTIHGWSWKWRNFRFLSIVASQVYQAVTQTMSDTVRRCKQTFFADKQDLAQTDRIVCPLPRCGHIWCRECQQPLSPNGAQHSCDGVLELNHLIAQRGWCRCPSKLSY